MKENSFQEIQFITHGKYSVSVFFMMFVQLLQELGNGCLVLYL